MINFSVVDSNIYEQKKIKKIINNWKKECKELVYITFYSNSEELLMECSKEGFHTDILIIEVSLDDKSGIEVARELREKHIDTMIIFHTNCRKYVYEAYRVNAFRFILKKESVSGLYDAIEDSYSELCNHTNYFTYIIKHNKIRIKYDTIEFLESKKRVIEIHVKGEEQTRKFYGKLNEIEGNLEHPFFIRVHQSYVVNLMHVSESNGKYLTLYKNDFKIPISRRYKNDVAKMLLQKEKKTFR